MIPKAYQHLIYLTFDNVNVQILKDRCCKIFDVLGNLVWDVDGNCGSDNSLDVDDLQDKLGQRSKTQQH